ncbi:MAG: hypothetical protein M1834_007902 [Cirrosporium novae-zelandiae]|nr:MAG: hypothetical protein M1834_007902 [Cirrosporium novae-zelandiae]
MADPLSIVGAVSAFAGIIETAIGFANALQSYVETVSEAQDKLQDIAYDVNSTITALQGIEVYLIADEKAVKTGKGRRNFKDDSLDALRTIFTRCDRIFRKIAREFNKAGKLHKKNDTEKTGKLDGAIVLTIYGKLHWPALEPKLNKYRGELESSKTTIMIILQTVQLNCNLSLNGENTFTPEQEKLARNTLEALRQKRRKRREKIHPQSSDHINTIFIPGYQEIKPTFGGAMNPPDSPQSPNDSNSQKSISGNNKPEINPNNSNQKPNSESGEKHPLVLDSLNENDPPFIEACVIGGLDGVFSGALGFPKLSQNDLLQYVKESPNSAPRKILETYLSLPKDVRREIDSKCGNHRVRSLERPEANYRVWSEMRSIALLEVGRSHNKGIRNFGKQTIQRSIRLYNGILAKLTIGQVSWEPQSNSPNPSPDLPVLVIIRSGRLVHREYIRDRDSLPSRSPSWSHSARTRRADGGPNLISTPYQERIIQEFDPPIPYSTRNGTGYLSRPDSEESNRYRKQCRAQLYSATTNFEDQEEDSDNDEEEEPEIPGLDEAENVDDLLAAFTTYNKSGGSNNVREGDDEGSGNKTEDNAIGGDDADQDSNSDDNDVPVKV